MTIFFTCILFLDTQHWYEVYVRDTYALLGNTAHVTCDTPFTGQLVAVTGWFIRDKRAWPANTQLTTFSQNYGRDNQNCIIWIFKTKRIFKNKDGINKL